MQILHSGWKPVMFGSLLAFVLGTGAYPAFGQGRGSSSPVYNSRTETTVTGVVQEVKEIASGGRGTGTHLVVKTDSGVIEVHVGPSWYLKQQNCEFKKDDRVDVIGSKVKFEGTDVLVARQIKAGDKTWTLRDTQGKPAWSQGRNP